MSRILVVDDERGVLEAFQQILADQGHQMEGASGAEAALRRLEGEPFDLVIMDICLPGMNGLDALQRVKKARPKLPVIVITGHGTMETAVEATKRGAFDYHLKPFEPEEMLQSIDRALQGARLMQGQVAVNPHAAAASGEAIIGHSPAMQQVYKLIGRVAETDVTVLIRGESGTGKELVARAIYQHSSRKEAPLLIVNCAAIPETLLESELFGYERGAFTGAARRRIGKFQQAHGGTVLLDEIGDMPPGLQAKVLRLLQQKSFEPLGSNQTVQVDVRLLAATNRDLEQAVAERLFRQDLYYRLNVVGIHLPPLRDRTEDIPELVDYFLARFAAKLGVEKPPLSAEALELLRSYSWPGNVRQLEHCIHRAVVLASGHPIQAGDLRLAHEPGTAGVAGDLPALDDDRLAELVRAYLNSYVGESAHEELLDRVEKLLVREALRRADGNQTHAARLLGMPRPTLHAKMHKHGLHREGGPAGPVASDC